MDSKKWTAIDFLNNAKKNCEFIDGYSIIYDIDKALALLIAEPEPCEDARADLDVTVSMICFFVQKIFERPGFCFTKDDRGKIKNYVSVYASQAADKRAEGCKDFDGLIREVGIRGDEVVKLLEQVETLARYEKALRFLHSSGPTPEGFPNDPNDCYEYACGLLTSDDDSLEDNDDPRWFEGWLLMIEAAMKREAIAATEPKPSEEVVEDGGD